MPIIEFFSQLDWRAFLLAMVIIELTPGPNMGWLSSISAQHGRRVGLIAVAGVTLGLAVQVLAAATGLATIISGLPVVYDLIRWAGVAFMLWLAWEAYSKTGSSSPVYGLSSKSFKQGVIANLLNPKALVFYVVVVGQFADPKLGSMWWQLIMLGAIHLCIAIAVHVAIVLLAASLGHIFESWRSSLGARLGFSISLVAVALWLAISTG
ncbi:MAG: threonine transporter RhtB [Hyphococcus sp.]|nr:MAG: threonine transporter RhtB [Marinicaulis sp.]